MKDGEVEDCELKTMLLLDEGLPDKYKSDIEIEKIIALINRPLRQRGDAISQKERNRLYEKIKLLYEQGLSDVKIGEKLEVHYSVVRYWRNKNKLLSNNQLEMQKNEKQFLKYYKKGFTDGQIHVQTGVAKSTIWSWRDKNDLPPNKKPIGGRKKND